MRLPILAQQLEARAFGQWHITIFSSFAVHARVSSGARCRCRRCGDRFPWQSQAAGIDGGETNFVTRQSDERQNLAHFFAAQNNRQLLLARRAQDTEDGPIALKGAFVEKLDAEDSDGRSVARVMFDVFDIEKVLTQLFFCYQVRRLVIMFGKLANGSGVRLLSIVLGEAPEFEDTRFILFRSSVMANTSSNFES